MNALITFLLKTTLQRNLNLCRWEATSSAFCIMQSRICACVLKNQQIVCEYFSSIFHVFFTNVIFFKKICVNQIYFKCFLCRVCLILLSLCLSPYPFLHLSHSRYICLLTRFYYLGQGQFLRKAFFSMTQVLSQMQLRKTTSWLPHNREH